MTSVDHQQIEGNILQAQIGRVILVSKIASRHAITLAILNLKPECGFDLIRIQCATASHFPGCA